MPGVSPAPVRGVFYAQNYFRIFVSDQVIVEFVREAELPSELALGERSLVKSLLNTGPIYNRPMDFYFSGLG